MKLKYRKRALRYNLITYGMVIFFYVLWEIMMNTGNMSSLMKGMLVSLCYYSMLAVSLNLVVGISGELSLGHAGFMCIGAFTGAIFAMTIGAALPGWLELLIAIILGALVSAAFGFLIGIPVLRLRGDYLAIVTLAFGEIIKNVINVVYFGIDSRGPHISFKDSLSLGLEPDGVTIIKGAQGISRLPRNATFTLGIILLLISLFIVLNLINSRHGRAIMTIRDNRIAAESIGISASRYKMLAFVIASSIAGVAGVLYSHNLSTLQSTSANFGYNQSIMILVFVVLGGIGNIRNSVIAATILTILPEKLRFLDDYRMLIYAVVLIAMMLFNSAPSAIEFRARMASKFARRKNGAEVDDER